MPIAGSALVAVDISMWLLEIITAIVDQLTTAFNAMSDDYACFSQRLLAVSAALSRRCSRTSHKRASIFLASRLCFICSSTEPKCNYSGPNQ